MIIIKNMRHTIFVMAILLFGLNLLHAQENSNNIKLLISSRVDTSFKDVREIIALYEDYYKSRPDSIHNNPYWNKKEKELYDDFDFSRVSIFQNGIDAQMLFKYYSPFVMSVEPRVDDKYQIRVLFSSGTTDPKYSGSKVWCIQKLNAFKENGAWVLENMIVELSKHWMSRKIGFIEYVYPSNHTFDSLEAVRGEKFCNEIIERFNPSFNETFKFFVTSNVDDMGKLENFDYSFVGISSGKAREGMILTAKGNEHYPHEFVHKLLPPNEKRGYIIEEGLASFLGTKDSEIEYEVLMSKLAKDLSENLGLVNFKSVVSQSIPFNGYQTAYPGGAGICELVYAKCGDKGLIDLLNADTRTFDGIMSTVCSITNLTEGEIEAEWNEIIELYRR